MFCYRHPGEKTMLQCAKCNRPICSQCVVVHPVSIRCPECGKATKIAAFDISLMCYLKAIFATLLMGILGVVSLLLVRDSVWSFGISGIYLVWIYLVGLGYMIGIITGLVVGQKQGHGLQWVVGGGTLMTHLIAVWYLGMGVISIVGLLALGCSIWLAIYRFRI